MEILTFGSMLFVCTPIKFWGKYPNSKIGVHRLDTVSLMG